MPEESKKFVTVAVAAPVRNLFTYSVPQPWGERVAAGHLLEVPFGKGTKRAIVLSVSEDAPAKDLVIKPIDSIIEPQPMFSEAMLSMLRWAVDYYMVPPGEMVFAALPPMFRKKGKKADPQKILIARLAPGVSAAAVKKLNPKAHAQSKILEKLLAQGDCELSHLRKFFSSARQTLEALKKKGLVELVELSRSRCPEGALLPPEPQITTLTSAQSRALSAIEAALLREEYAAFLLHGVTGSGKTEVYLRAIGQVLQRGKGALLLVPEISLTPQLLSRVSARFGTRAAVLHSAMGEGERLDEWRRLQNGQAQVAVGARSAVFAPVRSPGIIIVDEEHDPSYKQSERLPYNGRDLAMVRAQKEGAVVVLGTATPSVESYAHARRGRSVLLELPERVERRSMPAIEVVDLKKQLTEPLERIHTLSPRLAECLAEVLDRGEQAVLFLNRRGYSSMALCKDCGKSVGCQNCSVSLVYHLRERKLRCHYCGMGVEIPKHCAHCGGGRIQLFGMGTEKCEEEVQRRFPGTRIIRMDSDSVSRRGAVNDMVSRFARGEADILLGTQMVTKGHDLPGVTLVGVLLADLGLNLPDFRAAERTFQLLVQVSGRAGRGIRPGRVIVQTLVPEHQSIVLAQEIKFEEFFSREIARRDQLGYPPSRRLMLIRVSNPDAEEASGVARKVANVVRGDGGKRIDVLGPVASPLAKLRGRYRWQMLIKSFSVADLQRVSALVLRTIKVSRGTKILFDVDPLDML